jgi:hypothetical protein
MNTRVLISFNLLIMAFTLCLYEHKNKEELFCIIDVMTTAICIVSCALVCRNIGMICALVLCVGIDMFLWSIHGAGQLMYHYRHLAGLSDTILLFTIYYGFYKYKYWRILPLVMLIFVSYQFAT